MLTRCNKTDFDRSLTKLFVDTWLCSWRKLRRIGNSATGGQAVINNDDSLFIDQSWRPYVAGVWSESLIGGRAVGVSTRETDGGRPSVVALLAKASYRQRLLGTRTATTLQPDVRALGLLAECGSCHTRHPSNLRRDLAWNKLVNQNILAGRQWCIAIVVLLPSFLGVDFVVLGIPIQ